MSDHSQLWAPWRMSYIRDLEKQAAAPVPPACFLCEAVSAPDAASPAHDDADARRRLVLLDDGRGLILLNKYPYINGHLLVAPRPHVASLSDMTAPDRAGLMELTELAERILRTAMNPQGINIGLNLGRCAGAGVPGHLHIHVLPRWNGDTNFMQTIGQVRVIPQALEECYNLLAAALNQLRKEN